ncbi:hypothetical protein B0T20DRAFT_182864 [Sordaria brevicollis]|uniref:C2H2-type domain-containing protein n=1 Tax=Sordaria brevicollis TaxID=83679 RepID=A0AAE0PI36_SORBR|nr:hypothetical protein B0T20DRAFT_182864 [Sordaria brevicollis]
MDQQLPQCILSEVLSGEVALGSWDEEQWEWMGDTFWLFSEGLEGLEIFSFGQDPTLSQDHTSMLPTTCQQTLGTAGPAGDQYTDILHSSSLLAHFSTATSHSYDQLQTQTTQYLSLSSPAYSQTPSLDMSPIQSQGSPYSVGPIATPPTVNLPYSPYHEGENLLYGIQPQDFPVPASFAQQPMNPTTEGLVGDTNPENAQTHSVMSYQQAQNAPASNYQSRHSPKLSARRRRRKVKPEECPICGKGHAYKAELDRHMIAQHKDQAEQHDLSVERFLCPHCPQDFARKDHLTRHLQRKHGLPKGIRRRSKEN